MTTTEIAAKLTPAQVRALEGRSDERFLCRVHHETEAKLYSAGLFTLGGRLTLFGRAVLAELEGK